MFLLIADYAIFALLIYQSEIRLNKGSLSILLEYYVKIKNLLSFETKIFSFL